MPYIRDEDRRQLNQAIRALSAAITSPAALTYVFVRLGAAYVGVIASWTALSDVVKALECAKLEMYRRLIGPYEDMKKDENGDVFTANQLDGLRRLR